MKAFINSSRCISPQDSFYGMFPMKEVQPHQGQLNALEPNYKDFINPMKLRRMNRIIRMGLTTALTCLKDAGIEKPEGIISATGWGCLSDTFDFLDEIRENNGNIFKCLWQRSSLSFFISDRFSHFTGHHGDRKCSVYQ